jgi:hypothetical protein
MCFHSEYVSRKSSKVRDYVPTQYKVGQKVKVTRVAKSGENGWNNVWNSSMNEAVGKTGTVLNQDQYGVQLNIDGVGANYYYPEFATELVPAVPAVAPAAANKFKIGDRVRVTAERGATYSLKPATIMSDEDTDGGYYIKIDDVSQSHYFFGKNLELIPVTNEIKVGDRVKVTYSKYWDGNGTVVAIEKSSYSSQDIYSVRYDSGRRGGFYKSHVELIKAPVTGTRSSVGVKDILTGYAYKTALTAAINIARDKGVVTADDVQAAISTHGYTAKQLGNAAGAIFRSSKFRKIGETRSTRPSNRGRKIAQWSLAV